MINTDFLTEKKLHITGIEIMSCTYCCPITLRTNGDWLCFWGCSTHPAWPDETDGCTGQVPREQLSLTERSLPIFRHPSHQVLPSSKKSTEDANCWLWQPFTKNLVYKEAGWLLAECRSFQCLDQNSSHAAASNLWPKQPAGQGNESWGSEDWDDDTGPRMDGALRSLGHLPRTPFLSTC